MDVKGFQVWLSAARGLTRCCSASPFDPPESKRINMLPRRSASNLRA